MSRGEADELKLSAIVLELADAFTDAAGDDAGQAESGRIANLRFHLQPWCAIWSVDGVPADYTIPVREGATEARWSRTPGGRSYAVVGSSPQKPNRKGVA